MDTGGVPVTVPGKGGLEDVVVTTSAICDIDGVVGDGKVAKLWYRGYDVNDLISNNVNYEAVSYLLRYGELPTSTELAAYNDRLVKARQLAGPVLDILKSLPKETHPLVAYRTAMSASAAYDPEAESMEKDANERKGDRVIAGTATMVAAWRRAREGKDIVAPHSDLSHAANFMLMMTGEEPSAQVTKTMDVALLLHAEHEFNASTFAARVATATEADMHSAVVTAIGVLKGPKHGGANEDVVDMLDEIGSAANAEPWVKARLEYRKTLPPAERQSIRARFPGFGHRVYKITDPRSVHLRAEGARLAEEKGLSDRFQILEIVRGLVEKELGLPVNVDYYSAGVYGALGIPTDFATSIFAVARTSGWVAHITEQLANNRLIRPRSDYIGYAPRPAHAIV
jgi:citrate synthase